jgi:hypothetical protein
MPFLINCAILVVSEYSGAGMMPDKKSGGRFTNKEDRQAEHIKESEKDQGKSEKDAERIAYATVNKQKSEHKKKK